MRGRVFVLLIVLLAVGCLDKLRKEPTYVCPDGTSVSSAMLCPHAETSTTTKPVSSGLSADFSFQSGSGRCGDGNELSLTVSGGTLSLSGFLGTPTPCYALSASHAITEGIMLVEFYSTPSSGKCIECMGQVPFEMKMSEIPSGSFGLKVFYDYNPLIARNLVLVSDKGSLFFSCGTITGLGCPEGMQCVPDNPSTPDSAGRCRVSEKNPVAIDVAPQTTTSTTLVSETPTSSPTTSTTSPAPSTTQAEAPTSSTSQHKETSTTLTESSTSTVASTTTSPPSPSAVEISAVQFDAPGNELDNLNGEWVEVSNTGGTAQDMSSWTLSDDSNHVYSFPEGFVLGAQDSVKVHTGKGADSTSDLYWNRGSSVWNNDGDTATLSDESGNVIDSRTE